MAKLNIQIYSKFDGMRSTANIDLDSREHIEAFSRLCCILFWWKEWQDTVMRFNKRPIKFRSHEITQKYFQRTRHLRLQIDCNFFYLLLQNSVLIVDLHILIHPNLCIAAAVLLKSSQLEAGNTQHREMAKKSCKIVASTGWPITDVSLLNN